MPHILPTSTNETINEKTEDYYRSAQLAEKLQNASWHIDWKTQFVVYKHDRSAVLFFTIYGWKQENTFL